MASVKRYDLEYTNEYSPAKKMVVRENGDWIEATDYDRLVEVCRELLEYTNESCRHCGNETCESCLKWGSEVVNKALAIIGEGREEAK